MKDVIKMDKVIINNDQVTLTSHCTIYADEYKISSLNAPHLLKRFTSTVKALKVAGVKVSHKYKTRKFIADNVEEYNNAIVTYNRSFEHMVDLAKIISSKPLYVGTSTNKELDELTTARNKCTSMLRRSSIISLVNELDRKLTDINKELATGDFKWDTVYF